MPLNPAKKYNTEKKETPFKEQGYLARIVQIVDLGKQPQSDWQTKAEKDPKYEVFITWEFSDVRNDDNKPMWVSKRYQFPMAWPDKTGLKNNTNLYKLFREFVPECLKQSDMFPDYYFMSDDVWAKLLNKPAYVEITLTNKGAPKIKSVSKPPSFAGTVPPLENDPLLFDATVATVDQWNALFGWVKKIILGALDDETRLAAEKLDEAPVKKEEALSPAAARKGKVKKEAPTEDVPFDDDLPF